FAIAFHHHWQRLTGRQQRVAANRVPLRMLDTVKGNDAIAAPQSGCLRSAAAGQVADDRSGRRGHAVHQGADEGNRKRGNDIHHWSGQRHQNSLPAWAQIESLARRDVRSPFTFKRRIRFVAAEFYVSAKRNRRHAVVSVSPLFSKQSRPEADGKSLDANFEKL